MTVFLRLSLFHRANICLFTKYEKPKNKKASLAAGLFCFLQGIMIILFLRLFLLLSLSMLSQYQKH